MSEAVRVDLLEALLAEMRVLRSEVAELRGASNPTIGVLPAIASEFGPNLFTASEVIRRAESRQCGLRTILAANLRQVNARTLGRVLAKVKDRPTDGFIVRRIGDESAGAIWRLEPVGLKA